MPRTTYRWTSRAFMWAYFIYGSLTILVVYIFQARVRSFLSTTKRFDEIIYNIIFMSLLLPHFLLPVASWRNGSEVAKFKNMWTSYQLKYFKVTGSPIVFQRLTAYSWIGCVASWMISIIIMVTQYYFQPDFLFWHTFAYYHILAMLNGFCCLWFLNCTAFGAASNMLSESESVRCDATSIICNRNNNKRFIFRITRNHEYTKASQTYNKIPPFVGGLKPYDAATWQSLFKHVRPLLPNNLLYNNYSRVWCA